MEEDVEEADLSPLALLQTFYDAELSAGLARIAAINDADDRALARAEERERSRDTKHSKPKKKKGKKRASNNVRKAPVLHPNVAWRAITQDELRTHPRFVALPPPDGTDSGVTVAGPPSFRYVRQDSALWKELHRGVLTSSLIAAALGFYETRAALVVHTGGLVSHARAVDAQRHLAEQPRIGIGATCAENDSAIVHNATAVTAYNARISGKAGAVLAAEYRAADEGCGSDDDDAPLHKKPPPGIQQVRCAWGNAQEPAVVNGLLEQYPDMVIEEVGLTMLDPSMIPVEWEVGPLPPIGATADGRIRDGDSLELLEVKNVCPFVETFNGYVMAEKSPHRAVPPYMIPQVQLQLLVEDVSAARLASSSASQGTNVFRIVRDDDYIRRMLYYLSRFYRDYVLGNVVPPPQIFSDEPEYTAFLEDTAALASKATLVARIDELPRVDRSRNFFLP